MLLDVFDDYFIRHIPRTGAEISSCPYVTPPKGPAQGLILHHHFTGSLPLDGFHSLTYRYMRRNRYEYMHVIPRNMTRDNFNIIDFTYFTNQIPQPLCYFTSQNRLAVLRDPHNVIFDVIDGMSGFPVILHTASILKSSPEGEGFSPNPRRGQ